jgi:hypothetical protein
MNLPGLNRADNGRVVASFARYIIQNSIHPKLRQIGAAFLQPVALAKTTPSPSPGTNFAGNINVDTFTPYACNTRLM